MLGTDAFSSLVPLFNERCATQLLTTCVRQHRCAFRRLLCVGTFVVACASSLVVTCFVVTCFVITSSFLAVFLSFLPSPSVALLSSRCPFFRRLPSRCRRVVVLPRLPSRCRVVVLPRRVLVVSLTHHLSFFMFLLLYLQRPRTR